ncbi:MAG: DUF3015 family protein [Pseudomonadota bacterium]
MKKVVIPAALAILGMAGYAQAGNGPGCGWGATVWKGQSGFFAHTSAATTNGTTYNQLFGLTSGTAGCDPQSVVSNEFQREIFVSSNMDNLSREMARGGGDHLDVLASLMQIQEQDKAKFYSLTQAELPRLMNAADKGTSNVLAALDDVMLTDPILAKYAR